MSENPLIAESEGPSSGGAGEAAPATPYQIHGKALPATLVAILLIIVIMLAIHFKWVRWQQRQIRWLRSRPLSPSPSPSLSLPRLQFVVNIIPHTATTTTTITTTTTTTTAAGAPPNAASATSIGLDKAALDKALPAIPCDLSKDNSMSAGGGGTGGGILVLLQCMVCLEKFGDGEMVRALPACHHRFHADCIDRWFRTHSDCPLCRATIHLGGISREVEGPASSDMEGRSSVSVPSWQPETLVPTPNPGLSDPPPSENPPHDAIGVPILPQMYYITK